MSLTTLASCRAAVLSLATATAMTACSPRDRPAPADTATTNASADPAASAIKLPAGFTSTVFADKIGATRHAVAAPNGDIYVNTWRSPYDTSRSAPPGGYVVALRDTSHDGRADLIQRFGPTSESGSRGGTGIALRDNALYVEADSSILRYRLGEGDLVPTARPDTIVRGLTTEGGHPMHPIAVDGKGNLFVNMGSNTNACQEKDRQTESKGLDPCKELETRGGIWRFSATKTGQRYTPGARFATGIRNADGLAIHPGNGALYVTQHGRDQLAQNWPKLYDWKKSAELPAEELLRVEQGNDYGWPYCYYDPEQKKRVLAPEYGGDGKKVGRCADRGAPVAVFPAHWAPMAIAFQSDTTFPAPFREGAFIAFHGSWNRSPEPQQGYNVVFQPMAAGKATGDYWVFAEGFAGKQMEPGLADHRPAGLAIAPDGALIITDDQRGRVWRVAAR